MHLIIKEVVNLEIKYYSSDFFHLLYTSHTAYSDQVIIPYNIYNIYVMVVLKKKFITLYGMIRDTARQLNS